MTTKPQLRGATVRPSVRKVQEQSSREHNATVAANLLSRIDGAGLLQDLIAFSATIVKMLAEKGATLAGAAQRIYAEMDTADPSWKLADSKRSPRNVEAIIRKAKTGAQLAVIANCFPGISRLSVGWRATNRMATLAKLRDGKTHELDYTLPQELNNPEGAGQIKGEAVKAWVGSILERWAAGKLTRDQIGLLVDKATGAEPPSETPDELDADLAKKQIKDPTNRVRKVLKAASATARVAAMRALLAQSMEKPSEALDLAVSALIEQFTAEAVQASLTRLSGKGKKKAA